MELSSARAALASLRRIECGGDGSAPAGPGLRELREHVDVLMAAPVFGGKEEEEEEGGEGQRRLAEHVLALAGSASWRPRAVFLVLVSTLLRTPRVEEGGGGGEEEEELVQAVLQRAPEWLEDDEARLRVQVGRTLADCARARSAATGGAAGTQVFVEFQRRLAGIIRETMERNEQQQQQQQLQGAVAGTGAEDKEAAPLDDTTGWRALESSILAIQQLLGALGTPAVPFLDRGVATLICVEAIRHINRHVREAALRTIATLAHCMAEPASAAAPSAVNGAATAPASEEALHGSSNSLAEHWVFPSVVDALETGLQDNWSQVRYAASVATREALGRVSEQVRQGLWPRLVPLMCLNRYYLAEGVRAYSQDTWIQFIGQGGRALVAQQADAVAAYYVAMSAADNHVVREAACHAIAELASKIDTAAVQSHVDALLQALLLCFNDESWPVRDAACLATGRFVRHYPDQARPFLEDLIDHWLAHLHDPIWSVREDAAVAIVEVIQGCIYTPRTPLAQQHDNGALATASNAEHSLAKPGPVPAGGAAAATAAVVPATTAATATDAGSATAAAAAASAGTAPITSMSLQLPAPKRRAKQRLPNQTSPAETAAEPQLTDTGYRLLQRATEYLAENLSRAKLEEATESTMPQMRTTPAEDSAQHTHTDQPMFSCGSLAPKLRKGGCSDCVVTRKAHHWEFSDGCIYLLRELAQTHQGLVNNHVEDLLALARIRHFAGCEYLHETVWKCLPLTAERLGKHTFNEHLDTLWPVLADALRLSSSELARQAAQQAVRGLSQLYGAELFRLKVPETLRDLILVHTDNVGPHRAMPPMPPMPPMPYDGSPPPSVPAAGGVAGGVPPPR